MGYKTQKAAPKGLVFDLEVGGSCEQALAARDESTGPGETILDEGVPRPQSKGFQKSK